MLLFTAPITDTEFFIFGELQIGVLKDSAAFRDAVNLAANITGEPYIIIISLTEHCHYG